MTATLPFAVDSTNSHRYTFDATANYTEEVS